MKRMTAHSMRLFFLFLFLILAQLCPGQQDKRVNLSASAHFDFGLTQFQSIDDAGFGISVKALHTVGNKGALGAETSADWFLGEKLYFENGKNNRPAIYALRLGPYLYLSKKIMINAMYGVARYVLRETDFSTAGTYKLGGNVLFGSKNNLVTGFFFTGVQRSPRNVTHFGLSIGYRFF